MKISIVIPVYNEADRLAACLEAIGQQIAPAYEVIVVDNNSTDGTPAIARRFPFVTLLSESRQGVVHARNRGFNTASGDILGRIDADTIVPPDWTATITEIFSDHEVDAVSGSVNYYDVAYTEFSGKLDLLFRQQIANGMREEVFLYGANMAMRRKLWRQIRSSVCNDGGLHEDFDLAIHAFDESATVVFDRRLRAGISLRRADSNLRELYDYVMISPRTYAAHGRTCQKHMYPLIVTVLTFHWLIKLLHMGYDPVSGGFSVRRLFMPVEVRVNPARFVD